MLLNLKQKFKPHKIDTMTVHEIVNKLIGNINPVGETNTDNDRFENLKAKCELVNLLISASQNDFFIAYDPDLAFFSGSFICVFDF